MLQIQYYPSAKKKKKKKKKKRWSSPKKIHLQLTDILDRVLRRVSMIFCTFMETIIGVFICCFPVKKKSGNLMYRIEIWLLLQFIWLEIFCNKESSIFWTIQPSGIGVVFRCVLERQLRKLSVHYEIGYISQNKTAVVKSFLLQKATKPFLRYMPKILWK